MCLPRRAILPVVAVLVTATGAMLVTSTAAGPPQARRTQKQASRPANTGARPPARPATAGALAADPIRIPAGAAPQPEIDDAMVAVRPFFEANARVPRPYGDARVRIAALAAKYPSDPRVALKGAWLDERLGKFDEAAAGMERYATLAGQSPNALRRLAAFYRGRGRAADEARTLEKLASKLPPRERPGMYLRAIAAVNDARPQGLSAEPFYVKLLDVEPNDADTLGAYVSLLLESKDSARALRTLDERDAAPGYRTLEMRRKILAERARVFESQGQRDKALAVYESRFDPLWPRAVASDYYALLSRYGRYRAARRALQDAVAKPGTPLPTVARLFNFYAYEGNLPAAAKLLGGYEAARGGAWGTDDLRFVASLYAQIGDYDQASRYLYTLYLAGGVAPGSAGREEALARLFDALVSAGDRSMRLTPGSLNLYADVARVDQRPGALNGVLSLILAGNNPVTEFELEQARAAGYLNRALAHTVFVAFGREFPASPRLGDMTLGMIAAFADLGMDTEAAAAGSAFLASGQRSPQYEQVALAVADARVRLKDRAGERAVLLPLLDRLSARATGVPLFDRSTNRFVFRAEDDPAEDELHGGEVDNSGAEEYFVAPNGAYVPRSSASAFLEQESVSEYSPSDATDTSEGDDEYRYTPDAPNDYTGSPQDAAALTTYDSVLERIVASYDSDDRKIDALAFFWGEVAKHPRDEGLHERFLRWLGSTSLVNDQLKAYRIALERYDDGTWLHRFARWHVRRGRAVEIRRLTDEVIRTLDDEQVATYVREFAGYGGTPKGDDLDWDNKIALQVTRLAHQRFPSNVDFVKSLLSRFAADKNWVEWERLSREYYFADAEVRVGLLRRLSETKRLSGDYETAKRAGVGQEAERAFPNRVFAADAARWLSRFDEAIEAYESLVALYPGDRAYGEPLSDLYRSFGSRDPNLYAKAAGVLDNLAAVYPTDRRYPTRAGEALAQMGDMKGAADRWHSLVARTPGSAAAHLDAATLFWDYYQFDEAAAEIVALREIARDRTLYAYRLGAIYDSKNDDARAVPEYMRALALLGADKNNAAARLVDFAARPGGLDRIKSAYEAERAAAPDEWQLALGYADFLRTLDRTSDAVAVLDREVDARNDAAFVEEARGRFKSWRQPASEQRALERLVVVARDERDSLRARLRLAEFLDQSGKADAAAVVFDRLVAEHPTNAGVVEEAAHYYWRAGRRDKATALYKTTIAKASSDYRKKFALDLARRQADAKQLAEAEATLREYYAGNALDMDVFTALVRVLGDANKQDELAKLYGEGLARIREAGFTPEDENARIAELRTGMIEAQSKLGRFADAVDQYIEIVNRAPEDADVLDAAFDFASRHDLMSRLVAYYEKLAKDSYKDYRWSLVLGRLKDRTGDVVAAADAYKRASANEPQRIDIRGWLVDALVRAGRDEDAVAELRRAWELDGRDPAWLVRVARIRARQGQLDVAAAVMDEAIAARSKVRAGRIFEYAQTVAEWGMLDKAAQLFDRGLALARTKPEEADLDATRLAQYVRVATRVRPPVDVFRQLEDVGADLHAKAKTPDNVHAGEAETLADAVDEVERNAFADAVRSYGSPEERDALDATIRRAAAALPSVGQRAKYVTIAQNAGLVQSEEELRMSILQLGFVECDNDKGTAFRSALGEATAMLRRQGRHARAAEVLALYRDKKSVCGVLDYDRQIAENYRLAGDVPREIEALTRIYEAAAGDVTSADAGESVSVRRLFELLVSTGRRDRLVELAGRSSPYQLVLVNFLVARGEEELARRAIATTKLSPAWVKAKTAQVGLYFGDGSPAVEQSFRDVLAIRPIGEIVKTRPDRTQTLGGADYFHVARDYGVWLDAVANKPAEARRYIVGRLEQRPSDGAAQAQLARYYIARNAFDFAGRHADLALALSPDDREVLAVRGQVLFAQKKTAEALAAWKLIITAKEAGSEDYRVYFRELSRAGLVKEALGELRPVVVRATAVGRFGDVRDLLGDLGDFGREHAEWRAPIADALYGAAIDTPEDVLIAGWILLEDLLPPDRRSQFYRLLTDRIEGQAFAQLADPNGSSGFWRGEEWVDPVGELNLWRKRNVDFLIGQKAYAEASQLVDSIAAEQLDARGTLVDDDASHDYSWVDLARGTILARSGDRAGAVAALERYCASTSASGLPDRERCVRAALVLRAAGADAEADSLLEGTYRALLDARIFDSANFTGLAEVLYRRGRADEADSLLRRLAARTADSADGFVAAADAAGRSGRYALAIDFRESAARLARADADNALELARLRAASGADAGRATEELAAVVADERAPIAIRASAVELVAELAAGTADLGRAATSKLAGGGGEPGRVLAALLLGTGGDVEGARSALLAMTKAGPSALAAIELGRLELRSGAGRAAEAVAAFELALTLDSSGALADRIAFAGPTPTDALIRLYGASNRPYTALALAAERGGYAGDAGDDEESDSGDERFSFEPDAESAVPASGLASLNERNSDAVGRARTDAIGLLAEEAAALQRWDEAVAFARARVTQLTARGGDRTVAEKRLADLEAARRTWERGLERLLYVGTTVARDAVTVRDLVLD
jgi:cellulose synthase operon protein C